MFSLSKISILSDIENSLEEYDNQKSWLSRLFAEPGYISYLRSFVENKNGNREHKGEDNQELTFEEIRNLHIYLKSYKLSEAFERLYNKIKIHYKSQLKLLDDFDFFLPYNLHTEKNYNKLLPLIDYSRTLKDIFKLLDFANLLTQERFEIICQHGKNAENILEILTHFAERPLRDNQYLRYQLFSALQDKQPIIKESLEQVDLRKWCSINFPVKTLPKGLHLEDAYPTLSNPEALAKVQHACDNNFYGISQILFYKHPLQAESIAEAYKTLRYISKEKLLAMDSKYEDKLLDNVNHMKDLVNFLHGLFIDGPLEGVDDYYSLYYKKIRVNLLTPEIFHTLLNSLPFLKELEEGIRILRSEFPNSNRSLLFSANMTPKNILFLCKNPKYAPQVAKGFIHIQDLNLKEEYLNILSQYPQYAETLGRTIRVLYQDMKIALTPKMMSLFLRFPDHIPSMAHIFHLLNYDRKLLTDENLDRLAALNTFKAFATIEHLSGAVTYSTDPVTHAVITKEVLTQETLNLLCANAQYGDEIATVAKKLDSLLKDETNFKMLFSYLPRLSHISAKLTELSNNKQLTQQNYLAILEGIDKDNFHQLLKGCQPNSKDSVMHRFFGHTNSVPNHPQGEAKLLKVIGEFSYKRR